MRWDTESGARCTLTKTELQALLAFASEDAVREDLCQVWFEPKTGRVVATDGFSLLVLEDPFDHGTGDDFGVCRGWLEDACKLLRGKDELTVTTVSRSGEGRVALACPKGDMERRLYDRHFPAYQRLIPQPRGTGERSLSWPQRFDARLLARLELVQRAVYGRPKRANLPGERGKIGINVFLSDAADDETAPALFTAEAPNCSASAVIMPVRR